MALVTSMPKGALAGLCESYGIALNGALAGLAGPDAQPLDGGRVLWAMSGRESSFGQDMKPRHEPAYDGPTDENPLGGRYWRSSADVKQGVALYGSDFACSYGPLQVLAVNAKGWTPEELGADPEQALAAAVAFLRSYVLERCKARTLEQICDCWNAGHIGGQTTPGYVAEVTQYYLAGIPGQINQVQA